MDVLLKILATLGLVALNGYFVATEFCAVTARTSRLEEQAATRPLARVALTIKRNLVLYLSATQLGVTMASLGLGAVMEPAIATIMDPLLGLLHLPQAHLQAAAFTVSFAMGMSLHIVIGEQVPKNWAIRNSDRFLPYFALPLVVFTYTLYPIIRLLDIATTLMLRLIGVHIGPGGSEGVPHTAAELRDLLEESLEHTTLDRGHQKILTSAFDFGDLKVRQIMTPRTDVDYLTLSQPIGEVLRVVQKSAYTRLPLCDGDIDHVIGLVHMKDLFTHLKLVPGKLKFIDERDPTGVPIAIPTGLPGSAVHVIGSGDLDLRHIKRSVIFVPELLPVPKLLRRFQMEHIHLAVVVDEYGATQGIVTLEDVIEELVGDIRDEFDTMSPAQFVKEGDAIRLNGLYPLHELREQLSLSEEDLGNATVDTVGGYIIDRLKRWPRAGDTIPIGPYTAQVMGVQQKRITQVLLTPTPKPTETPGDAAA